MYRIIHFRLQKEKTYITPFPLNNCMLGVCSWSVQQSWHFFFACVCVETKRRSSKQLF